MRGHAWTLAVLGASGAYLAAALTLPFGSVVRPGPGFFPVGVGVFLCLVAAALLTAALRGGPVATMPSVGAGAGGRLGTTVAALAGFPLLLPWIGYPACAFVFVALLLRRLGGAGWAVAAATAAASALVTYYVFGALLGVPLPGGPL